MLVVCSNTYVNVGQNEMVFLIVIILLPLAIIADLLRRTK